MGPATRANTRFFYDFGMMGEIMPPAPSPAADRWPCRPLCVQGSLLFYDFGMMGEIIPNVRERLLDVFYGIYRKDSGQIIKALTDLGVIKVCACVCGRSGVWQVYCAADLACVPDGM
jgi:predicted unusual protein kinase regulating ubiquinone biosynthesis (AarF/ABC1/UbiB family)